MPAELPPAITEALAALAEFAALARSPVFFDARGEVELVPEPEAPGRLAKQLALLAQALSNVRQESVVSADTYLTVYQVAHDTMPAQRRLTLDVLLNPPRPEPTTTRLDARGSDALPDTDRPAAPTGAGGRPTDRPIAGGSGPP